MNKSTKIIVSIVGITIVLLALLGITYAYYLTRIEGNTNTDSITVTTAKLELTYGDGNGILLPYGTIEPNSDESIKFYKTDASGNPITNESPVDNKTFTVTNNGNDSSYVVIIDNVSITKASDGSETNFVSNDFRYTLSCSVKDKSGNTVTTESCNDVESLSIFPIKGGILVGNDIPEDRVHEYTLTLWYIDTGIDQSDDMGKSYQARVNIKDMTAVNPFSTGVSATDNASLVYNIINNAKTNKNGTTFVNNPLTNPAVEISGVTNYKTTGEEATFVDSMSSISSNASKTWYYYDTYEVNVTTGKFTLLGKQSCTYSSCYSNLVGKFLYNTSASDNSNPNNHTADTKTDLSNVYKVTSATASALNYRTIFNSPNEAERVLVPTTDDYGISYYYRGDVKDNYVNFAGMCWRVVRIEGDGSTKLILEDMYSECNNLLFTGNWSDGNTYVFGYDNSTGGYRLNLLNYGSGLADSFKTFQTDFLSSTDLQKLKIYEWCYDDIVTSSYSWGYDSDGKYTEIKNNAINGWYKYEYYGAYTRIFINKKTSLNCYGTKLAKYKDGTNMYVGTLTVDEMVFAGATTSTNYNYYLMNSYSKAGSKGLYFWSLSPSNFNEENGNDRSFGLDNLGHLYYDYVNSNYHSRPSIILKAGTIVSYGEGTLEKPFVIV